MLLLCIVDKGKLLILQKVALLKRPKIFNVVNYIKFRLINKGIYSDTNVIFFLQKFTHIVNQKIFPETFGQRDADSNRKPMEWKINLFVRIKFITVINEWRNFGLELPETTARAKWVENLSKKLKPPHETISQIYGKNFL